MIGLIAEFWAEIREEIDTPDIGAGVVAGAGTDAGHFVIGALLALLLPWWVVLGGYAVWEAQQYLRAAWRDVPRSVFDSALDAGFVTLGALGLLPGFALLWAGAAVWRFANSRI